MGQHLKQLMQYGISHRLRLTMPQLVAAAKLDNPNPYTKLHIGDMLTFKYNAKWKDTLPYWDAFPLIFVVDVFDKGFYGINLHYLPIDLRKTLLSKLELNATGFPNLNAASRLRISYQILSGTQKYPEFYPCFKHYLTNHVQSPFLKIEATEWNVAILLPYVRFQKSNVNQVYTDSRKTIFNKKFSIII